jgi:hypothetical protein
MALRGVKPKEVTAKKRFKCLLAGEPGVGKTTASLGFSNCYMLDTERGAENPQYVQLLQKNKGAYLFCPDYETLDAEVNALMTEKHPYKTLIIDPMTTIYDALVADGIVAKGDDFGRFKMHSDPKMKNLCQKLLRLDMNLIVTSHAKAKWVQVLNAKGKKEPVQEGFTFDCYPKLEYLFDLYLHLEKRDDKTRWARVKKTRLAEFPEDDYFPFSYAEIVKRYGIDVLERDAVAIVPITDEQLTRIKHFVKIGLITTEVLDKWLDKNFADSLEEVDTTEAAKCIKHYEAQVATEPEPKKEEVAVA